MTFLLCAIICVNKMYDPSQRQNLQQQQNLLSCLTWDIDQEYSLKHILVRQIPRPCRRDRLVNEPALARDPHRIQHKEQIVPAHHISAIQKILPSQIRFL